MAEQKSHTPLKMGLLTVTVAYFLFNLHTMFTLEWIGEWARTPGVFNTLQLIEDINATIGNSFRMTGSIIAIVALVFYFVKKSFSKNKSYLVVRAVLVFEAILPEVPTSVDYPPWLYGIMAAVIVAIVVGSVAVFLALRKL